MRTKHQAAFALGFVGLFCLATACGDDGGGTPSGNEAGESGAGADSGGGGKASGGTASASNAGKASAGTTSAGNGGTTSSNGGATSSNGGEPIGVAGEPSSNGGSGDGGKPSTDGGQDVGGNPAGGEPSGLAGAAGAGGSDGGPVVCTPITLGQFGQAVVDFEYGVYQYARYSASFTPNIGTAAEDSFRVLMAGPPDFDGHRTGAFDLTQNGDDNYQTCSRCLLAYADGNQKTFFPSEGTLTIAAGSKPLGGTIDATLTNVKLVEVTLNGEVSTPVPNGACLTVASATVQVEAPACGGFECDNGACIADASYECDEELDCPDDSDEFPVNASCEPFWTCPQNWLGDGDCDCGCGIKDTDCDGTTDETECAYCVACQGNSDEGCKDNEVNPANTTKCL